MFKDVKDYYSDSIDLYRLALQKCFKATRYTIAIIPETFINSSFPKNHLVLLSVIIKNPFATSENAITDGGTAYTDDDKGYVRLSASGDTITVETCFDDSTDGDDTACTVSKDRVSNKISVAE